MGFDQISLKGRALRLLAGREHSRAELQRKLSPHETEPGELARALDELQAKGFINEQRVLESVLHRRATRLGAARVRQELQAKGLDPQAVADAVAGLQETEEARAREVWRRKFGAPPQDVAEHGRQVRFLLARGFSATAVRRVVRGGPGDSED
ncbi:recombination regulator RecX [Hydrogenophaga sp.]|uniref:recombination regulator RecX n=1 Tax=Hydrogenophaga sp. TaxID=1904254 RepID=UPI003D12EA05